MKKINFVLAILAVALVLGLALVGCSSESDDPPVLTVFFPVLHGDYSTQITSFAVGDPIGFTVRGSTHTHDVTKFVITIKSGVTVVNTRDGTYNPPITKEQALTGMNHSTWTLPTGNYTAECYWEDAKGNKSNTMTAPFTVTQ